MKKGKKDVNNDAENDLIFQDNEDLEWYIKLSEEGRFLYKQILKYHNYFNKQDRKYRWISRLFKLLVLFFSMVNTIVLGIKIESSEEMRMMIGLIISAVITFITAITAYFNFEEYWMRNITIHIELNILRDNFIYEAKAGKLADKGNLENYRKKLEEIQIRNIKYWQRMLTTLN